MQSTTRSKSTFLGFGYPTEPHITSRRNAKKTSKVKTKKEHKLHDELRCATTSSVDCLHSVSVRNNIIDLQKLHPHNTEILMLESSLLMSRRLGCQDRYRELRLDVDSMTYEDLLELGEKIGHVNTGLEEDKIGRCLRTTKLSLVDESSSQSCLPGAEPKCSICQEEYEADDELGKLDCGHAYHLDCIKQWLSRKNACPFCKAEAS